MRSLLALCALVLASSCGIEAVPADAAVPELRDAGITDGGRPLEDAGQSQQDAGLADAGAAEPDAGAGCTSTSARAGWKATLTTAFHGVSGQVTVADDCTLTVSHFTYDGQGLDVRFYVAAAGSSFAMGTGLGPQLHRPAPWNDETLTLELPQGLRPEDFDRISVWCIDVGIDFGSGTFAP